jgi:hypothetical protein
VLETLSCLWNFRIHSGKKWNFQQFLPLMQPRPYKVASPICRCIIKSWQISCRYVYVFRKSNSIIPIHHNLSFCEPRSSIPLCKMRFRENQFYKGNARLCSTKTKIVMNRDDRIWFSKNVNIFGNLSTFYDTHTVR